jgi:hypothetical protein
MFMLTKKRILMTLAGDNLSTMEIVSNIQKRFEISNVMYKVALNTALHHKRSNSSCSPLTSKIETVMTTHCINTKKKS